jgi:alkanesulfonate monooxygenase SsuD/methylene tetrahydromethanopterin reductase-like flavin-dependent oxidoreductase (luciferase family)
MKFGVVVPFSDAPLTVALAREAEAAGWDGLFLPELVWGIDPWAQLAAAAVVTERIRLGTMLTPLPWVRPWTLAGQAGAVDHLSKGRTIIAVGLGAPDAGGSGFPLEMERKVRAELLDEGLDVLTGLWSGEPFEYSGKHYRVDPTPFSSNTRPEGMPPPPPPVQRPRIPIWVVGVWPGKKSMQRALRYDGLLPATRGEDGVRNATVDEVAQMVRFARDNRPADMPFDVIVEGETAAGGGADVVGPYSVAGATWWIESRWMLPSTSEGVAEFRERVMAGPPRGG